MGMSAALAPQSSCTASPIAQSSPDAVSRPSAVSVSPPSAALCSPVADYTCDLPAAVTGPPTSSIAADTSSSPLAAPAATLPATSTASSVPAAKCESGLSSGLDTAAGSVNPGDGEGGSRATVPLRRDGCMSLVGSSAPGKKSDAPLHCSSSTEDSAGSAAAAVGCTSADAAVEEDKDTDGLTTRQTPALAPVAALAPAAGDSGLTVEGKEAERKKELHRPYASLSVGKSLTIGITSPLYASTLRRNSVNVVCENRSFFSGSTTAAGQTVGNTTGTSKGSKDIAGNCGTKNTSGSIGNRKSSNGTNAGDRRTTSTSNRGSASSTRSRSGTAETLVDGSESSSNSSCSGSITTAAGGRESDNKTENTGMSDSEHSDNASAPASYVQAKEQQQISSLGDRRDSAAPGKEKAEEKERKRTDVPEESRSLRAAIGEGPLGKLLQRFGAGNSSSSVNSRSSGNCKVEDNRTGVRSETGEDPRESGHPAMQLRQHRSQQQQPEQPQQQRDGQEQQGQRSLTSHGGSGRHVGEEYIKDADEFPCTTALFHSLQQQLHAGWPPLPEERRRRISDSAGSEATMMPLWTIAPADVLEHSGWRPCVASATEAGSSVKHNSNQHASLLVLTELQRLRGEMLQLQMAAAAAKPANIIIQNKTEVAASTETSLRQPKVYPEEPGVRERLSTLLNKFFSSRLNQVLVLCGLGLGCYMLLEHWRHTWRMAQLRRRVDSNIVLRGVQMLEETIGVRRPQSSFYY